MNQIPNIEEDSKEEFLHLLHQVVQHTPLKIEETAGTDYDRGYIFYQDMVLRDVEELETTMWDWHHHQLQKARQDWLQEEIVKLEGMKQEEPDEIDYDGTGLSQYGFNSALQTIIDRYQSELDQEVSK